MQQTIKRLFAPRDMTQGKPMTGLILFAIPLLIGNFAQQLYNTVDAIVVGQYLGDDALGAVGLTGPIINLLLVLFMGVSTGATIVVSQYFGAKDRLQLSKAVGTTVMLTLWTGIATMVIGLIASKPLLRLLGTPENMLPMANDYLTIIFAGIVGCAFYNILGGVLRGLGDSISPLIYLLISTVLNIGLDILFVTAFAMGTAGVAWATIIAQGISAVLCYLRLKRMTDVLDLTRKELKMDKAIGRRIIALGVPAGMTQMIFSLSSILVQNLTNTLGPVVVTTCTAVMRVDGFAMMPNFTFGTAATTFTGQNIGARRMDRVRQGAKDCLILALVCATALTLCILLFGRQLMGVFTHTEEIVSLGARMMRLMAIGYIAFGATQTLSGVMRGAGETVQPMWISIIATIVIRLPSAYLLAYLTRSAEWPNGDPMCLYWSLLASWLSCCAMCVIIYARGKWRKKAEMQLRPVEAEPTAE